MGQDRARLAALPVSLRSAGVAGAEPPHPKRCGWSRARIRTTAYVSLLSPSESLGIVTSATHRQLCPSRRGTALCLLR
jgi:hypothetical protein